MSLIHDRAVGPDGKTMADSVACLDMFMRGGATFTNFNVAGPGLAVGIKGTAYSGNTPLYEGAVMSAILSPEDTEELRQQLNAWYGRKANLVEVKNG